MNNLQLTPHFKLSEFTNSSLAEIYLIDNTLDPENPIHQPIISNIQNLCVKVLEPLRMYVKRPITLSSGYRCPQLNRAVSGAAKSQHMAGEAADIHIPFVSSSSSGLYRTNMVVLELYFNWIISNCDFDQIIKETANGRIWWIHVSCKLDPAQNRHKVIPEMWKK